MGESGKQIKSSNLTTLESCQHSCSNEPNCKGIDFTETIGNLNFNGNPDQCRLFPLNIPRTDPGLDQRVYCYQKRMFFHTLQSYG